MVNGAKNNFPTSKGQPNSGIQPLSNEERREHLKKMYEDVENRQRALNSKKKINQNELREKKLKTIRMFYEMLRKNGVDPNDVNSIRDFLDSLAERDPDFLALFENAFNSIMPEDIGPVDSQNLEGTMAQFNNLSERVLRQPEKPQSKKPQLGKLEPPVKPGLGKSRPI